MSRFAVFPKFNTPDDPTTGDPSRIKKPISSETPATSHSVAILNKTKGCLKFFFCFSSGNPQDIGLLKSAQKFFISDFCIVTKMLSALLCSFQKL